MGSVIYQHFRTRCVRESGFTISELLVASILGTLVLLGAYKALLQATHVDDRMTNAWTPRRQADAVLRHIASSLRHTVNIPETLSLYGGPPQDEGNYTLMCFSKDQLLRYQWNSPQEEENGLLKFKTVIFSGSVPISSVTSGESWKEDQSWDDIDSIIIGRRIDAFSVTYRDAQNTDAPWQNSWDGPVGNVAIRVRVTIQGQTFERVIIPRANVPAMEERS